MCLLRGPASCLGGAGPAEPSHKGGAVLRLGACHHCHGHQQVRSGCGCVPPPSQPCHRLPFKPEKREHGTDPGNAFNRVSVTCSSITNDINHLKRVSLKIRMHWLRELKRHNWIQKQKLYHQGPSIRHLLALLFPVLVCSSGFILIYLY